MKFFNIFITTNRRKLSLPPYEYIQRDIETNLHSYLNKIPSQIENIIIVGAHLGYEVNSINKNYPNSKFILFEVSPKYVEPLISRFKGCDFVSIYNCAISNVNGDLDFFETNTDGTGSILKVGALTRSFGIQQTNIYRVRSHTLDNHSKINNYQEKFFDCLWVDVQGAEMAVLQGGINTLKNVRSIFIEVSTLLPLYEGGCMFEEIYQFLIQLGFRLVNLGTDHSNGTGNAFFINNNLNPSMV